MTTAPTYATEQAMCPLGFGAWLQADSKGSVNPLGRSHSEIHSTRP